MFLGRGTLWVYERGMAKPAGRGDETFCPQRPRPDDNPTTASWPGLDVSSTREASVVGLRWRRHSLSSADAWRWTCVPCQQQALTPSGSALRRSHPSYQSRCGVQF